MESLIQKLLPKQIVRYFSLVFVWRSSRVWLLTFGLGFLLLQIQVRVEGEYLLETYGAAYQDYIQRVPRWF